MPFEDPLEESALSAAAAAAAAAALLLDVGLLEAAVALEAEAACGEVLVVVGTIAVTVWLEELESGKFVDDTGMPLLLLLEALDVSVDVSVGDVWGNIIEIDVDVDDAVIVVLGVGDILENVVLVEDELEAVSVRDGPISGLSSGLSGGGCARSWKIALGMSQQSASWSAKLQQY